MPIIENARFGKTENVIVADFGRGDIEMTYSEVVDGKIVLAFKEHKIPQKIDVLTTSKYKSFDDMKPPIIFRFSNPKSIEAIIHQLQDMKQDLIDAKS